jgi:guanylate kinase
MSTTHEPFVIILSSPSGAGKTSITKKILDNINNISMSISVTTREKRPGEIDGKDYLFISQDEFDQMVQNKELLENATVYDKSYGTRSKDVTDLFARGNDILFDVDWQGKDQISAAMTEKVISIYILPPSIKILQERLINRGTDSIETIQKRISKAKEDISHAHRYDYILINDSLEKTVKQVEMIIIAERLKRTCNKNILKRLLSE